MYRILILISIASIYFTKTYAQMDSARLVQENICYSFLTNHKDYGRFVNDDVIIDSSKAEYRSFHVSCSVDRILEVKNSNSWKTYYVLTTYEDSETSYSYTCVGTDSKRYVFILELESKTLTKMYEDSETFVEINMIYDFIESSQ